MGPHLVEDGEGDAEDAGGDEADEVVRGPDVERHPAAERRQPDHQHQVQLIYIYIDRARLIVSVPLSYSNNNIGGRT